MMWKEKELSTEGFVPAVPQVDTESLSQKVEELFAGVDFNQVARSLNTVSSFKEDAVVVRILDEVMALNGSSNSSRKLEALRKIILVSLVEVSRLTIKDK